MRALSVEEPKADAVDGRYAEQPGFRKKLAQGRGAARRSHGAVSSTSSAHLKSPVLAIRANPVASVTASGVRTSRM